MALIVARHGPLRDGLYALVSTIPELGVVSSALDLDSALEFVMEHCPAVILLEINDLDPDQLVKIESMKVTCPQTGILALAQHSASVPGLVEASGVDAVLMQGVDTRRLTETISALIASDNEEKATA
jgi:DNA-binding NarL/FixJ family response regulator